MAGMEESRAFAGHFLAGDEVLARRMIDWLDEWRRKTDPVGQTLCGAPTTRGHPCQHPRTPGLQSGCNHHPNWRAPRAR